jgi:hypothetical protein
MRNKKFIYICFIGLTFHTNIWSYEFKDNKDGTIVEVTNNIIWQKCSAGQSIIECDGNPTRMSWKEANNYCENLNIANLKWRLPEFEEFKMLIDPNKKKRIKPYDIIAFPNSYEGGYWSATEDTTYLFLSFCMIPGQCAKSYIIHLNAYGIELKSWKHGVKCISEGN